MDKTALTFRLQTAEEVVEFYNNRMTEDFPPEELRPLSSIRKLMQDGLYDPYGIYIGLECVGYAYCMRLPETNRILLDYYAIRKDLRGQGIGNRFLQQLRAMGDNIILIESEDPDFAANPADFDLQTRRVAFYRRSGAQLSEVRASAFGVPFRLLILAATDINESEVAQMYADFYRILAGERYEQAVKITTPAQ